MKVFLSASETPWNSLLLLLLSCYNYTIICEAVLYNFIYTM